jgi:hypothetical protein
MLVILFYVSGVILLIWGLTHILKTGPVVNTFGQLSAENKRVLTMEWVNEGILLILISLIAILGGLTGLEAPLVYWISAAILFTMAIVSLFTGAKNPQIPFKLCPPIFTLSAILIIAGTLL